MSSAWGFEVALVGWDHEIRLCGLLSIQITFSSNIGFSFRKFGNRGTDLSFTAFAFLILVFLNFSLNKKFGLGI